MRVTLVVAVARNGAIGRDGGLPWRLPGDLAFFKRVTMHKPIVMGRKTWDSLPRKPLPGRSNLVVTRQSDYRADGATVFSSLTEALSHAATFGPEEICVIGGAEIYRQSLPLAERIYLTEVEADPDADTFFPNFDRAGWREEWREPGPPGEGAPDYSFVLLSKRLS